MKQLITDSIVKLRLRDSRTSFYSLTLLSKLIIEWCTSGLNSRAVIRQVEKMNRRKVNKNRKILFKRSKRGLMIECLIRLSNLNDGGYKITKQGVEVGLYFTQRGKKVLPGRSYFYNSLTDLSENLKRFSGRNEFSSNGTSEALKALDHHGFLIYKYDLPNLVDKHGERKGIKVQLLKRNGYVSLLEKLDKLKSIKIN